MPYSFIYDLTRIPRDLLSKILELSYNIGLCNLVGSNAKKLVKMFNIDEITGLNFSDAITLVQDLIEIQIVNHNQRQAFEKAQRKAILIPHCARAYMDKRCMADFDKEIPTYICNFCTEECLVSKATTLGKKMNYDVYIIPGGSCVEKILKDNNYQGVIGVACGMELKMAIDLLKKMDIAGQGVFLTKNGCVNTKIDLESLERVLCCEQASAFQ